MKNIIKKIILRLLDIYCLIKFYLIYSRKRKALINGIKQKQFVKVAFIVNSLPMWKSQQLVDLLTNNKHFQVKIIIAPTISFTLEQQKDDIQKLRNYFNQIGQEFIDYKFDEHNYDLRNEYNPDLLFYQQPYENLMDKLYDYNLFKDKLIAYIPYSFWPGAEVYGFDLPFHRYAWKIFYANDLILRYAQSVSLIKAKNSCIVGYPSADLFLKDTYKDVWKKQANNVKRIIWSPHFSIQNWTWSVHSSFLDVAYSMLQYAKENVGKLQFAFKPHPRLKTELYQEWGKEKTDAYFNEWATMPNTQLEAGEYIDLFMTSDCLIHDCGSFIVEYQYTLKPSLYLLKDIPSFRDRLNELGKKALDMHYRGSSIDDIKSFVEKVVIEGKDILSESRQEFYKIQLLPPNNRSVAENIIVEICKTVGINE